METGRCLSTANLVGGTWREAEAKANINPSDVTDVIGKYAQTDRETALEAIAAPARPLASSASSHRGTFRSPSPPGSSRRRSLTETRSPSRLPPSSRAAPGRSPISSPAAASPTLSSTRSWDRSAPLARRSSRKSGSTPSASPAPSKRAAPLLKPAPRVVLSLSSNVAA